MDRVTALNAQGKLLPLDHITFEAASLAAFSYGTGGPRCQMGGSVVGRSVRAVALIWPRRRRRQHWHGGGGDDAVPRGRTGAAFSALPADLDKFTANLRLNQGRVRAERVASGHWASGGIGFCVALWGVPVRRACARPLRRARTCPLPHHGVCLSLDRPRARGRADLGQLSMFIKRWCNASDVNVVNAGIDDNAYSGNNVGYVCAGWPPVLAIMMCQRPLGARRRARSGAVPQRRKPRGPDVRPERRVCQRQVHVRHKLLRRRIDVPTYV